ncbi:NAD-dependent epimerase/dehydratase family protein [Candidatus Neomarinimicrobiota bacterium]
MKIAIVIGGSGFVGRHMIRSFLNDNLYDQIIVCDLIPPPVLDGRIVYIPTDVRTCIDPGSLMDASEDNAVIIYNLAAICRIPGFPDKDYFETNTLGARNVCALADEIRCRDIIFTSSISIYGASEDEKIEESLPQPNNPYGISKLVAEHIHRAWQASDPAKNLLILRPGIIFGQDEDANFTRLYKAIAGRYFLYPGRRNARKSSIYVKDMVSLCYHLATRMQGLMVYNLTYPTAHTTEEICAAIAKITGKSRPKITIPAWLLLLVASGIFYFARLLGKREIRFHPDRVNKLMVSTNVSGKKIEDMGYHMQFSLEDAILDWYKDCAGKGLF